MITGSFSEAMKAQGFLEMAELNFWPYGNANEFNIFDKWVFYCQHGEAECQYNFIETCAKKHISDPTQYFNFLSCVELHAEGTDYQGAVSECAKQAQFAKADDIMNCATGDDGLNLEHEIAVKTDALNPPHTYVPWVTVNDVFDENV
jgi:interferon gamma-inducible protein 30